MEQMDGAGAGDSNKPEDENERAIELLANMPEADAVHEVAFRRRC
jgi:hypothetical protein